MINAQDSLDIRAGIIASTMANSMSKKEDGTAFTFVDFFPHLKKFRKDAKTPNYQSASAQTQSTQEQIIAMQTWMTVFKQHEIRGAFAQKPPAILPGVSEILPVEG